MAFSAPPTLSASSPTLGERGLGSPPSSSRVCRPLVLGAHGAWALLLSSSFQAGRRISDPERRRCHPWGPHDMLMVLHREGGRETEGENRV